MNKKMQSQGVKSFIGGDRLKKKHEMAKRMSAHLKKTGRHMVEPHQPKEKDEGEHLLSKGGYNRA